MDCVSKSKECMERCEPDCFYVKRDSLPLGVRTIPGAGHLSEYPEIPLKNDTNDTCLTRGSDILGLMQSLDACTQAYHGNLCIKECCEFAGAAGLNFVNGDLIITSSNTESENELCSRPVVIHDVMPNLVGVSGNIYIVNTDYKRISGFKKLRYVAGSIVIAKNQNLLSMPEFPALLTVSKKVWIPDECNGLSECSESGIIVCSNPVLRKLSGFENVRQVDAGIYIADNCCLTDICGFVHLYRTDRVVISNNPLLRKILGFCNVDKLTQGLYLLDNGHKDKSNLEIFAFSSLDTAGNVVLMGNVNLKVVELPALKDVCGHVVIRCNSYLELVLMPFLLRAGSIFIENNRRLFEIGFGNVREICDRLSISSNDSMSYLHTFDKLKSVGKGIVLSDNKELLKIDGFHQLKYVGSDCCWKTSPCYPRDCCDCKADLKCEGICGQMCDIRFEFDFAHYDQSRSFHRYALPDEFFVMTCNPDERTCNSDPEVNTCVPNVVNYSIIIYGNRRLQLLDGFHPKESEPDVQSLKHLECSLYIVSNCNLLQISAFKSLCSALDIWIRNNTKLAFIHAFESLLSIRDLIILETPCLKEVHSLEKLEFAQHLYLESKFEEAAKMHNCPIPSVLGYNFYYDVRKQ